MFLGKGGVGKTTVSSAYAIARAAREPKLKIALISSDPAHSLADVFEHDIGDKFKRIRVPGAGSIVVSQIDAEQGLQTFLSAHRPELLELLEQGTFFAREDIEPLLDTTLPGIAEISALLRIDDLIESGEFDEIVVDTAPMGHTLRLLELPQSFVRFLDFLEVAGSRDQVLAATFGGRGRIRGKFIEEWREKSGRMLSTLGSPESRIVMVSSPEQFSLREIERSVRVLGRMTPALKVSGFVLNRVAETGDCTRCAVIAAKAEKMQSRLVRLVPGAKVQIGRDDGAPIMGVAQLKAFGEEVFYRKRRPAPGDAPRVRMPEFISSEWPGVESELSFSIGKGGVGKTTVAASIAFVSAERDRKEQISICSADPAPSLDDVFAERIGEERVPVAGRENLWACEIDAQEEFRRWVAPLQDRIDRAFAGEKSGLHVELAFERELFSSLLDIVPPGVDELFAVLRIAEITEGGKNERLIVDMAPTGHALELLRTPARMLGWSRLLMKSLAPHRKLALAQEIAVEVASISQRVRGLETLLQHSQNWLVLLAEPLPDRETERLRNDLKALQLGPSSIFFNRILVHETPCPRCTRARAWQAKTLATWKRHGSRQRTYVVPEFGAEVAGAAKLKKFTRSILEWR